MDPYDPRPAPARSASEHTLSHRISNLSEIQDYETYEGYTPESDPQSPPLRGRESLVSLQSSYDGVGRSPSISTANRPPAGHAVAQSPSSYTAVQTPSSYTPVESPASYGGVRSPSNYDDGSSRANSRSSSWSNPFTSYGAATGGYEAVPLAGVPSAKRSRTFSRRTSLRHAQGTIPEEPENIRESIDLTTLVSHAAPMGQSTTTYAPLLEDDAEDAGAVFDVTGFMGPATSQDEAFIKTLQEQEASGKLTGGLGVGLSADTTIRESELLATGPPAERGGLARSFTRRAPVGRQGTVKALAQSEANKRGAIVEVIVEKEPDAMSSEVDLSVMVGPAVSHEPGGMRRATLPTPVRKTYFVYPQPDWKPFSMRWPYLLFLIVLSIALGGAQEVLYQVSTYRHLLEFRSPAEIPGVQYFVFKFVPTLVSVTFGVLWQMTDFEVRRLEAYYQLSKEGGALADESINVDYLTSFSFWRPLRALYCKHYAVAVSSVTSLLAVSLVPTLCTACVVLNPDRATRAQHPGDVKFITIHPVWSRFLTAVLFVVAALGCVLFWQLQRRKTGLTSDVKGIAGLASMAVVSHILTDFKDMDVATHKDIHAKLKDRRYALRNSSLAPDDETPVSKQEVERYKENHLSQNPHPLMLRGRGCVPFIAGIVIFGGLVPVFLFTNANALTDKAPWVVTALAVCIKLSWGALETSVRMMEPYYILSRRHAPPKTLSLDYTAMPFAWVAVRAILNGHVLVFLVGFGTVMTELLTVLVTSLATVEGRDYLPPKTPGPQTRRRQEQKPPPGNGTAPSMHDMPTSGQETPLTFWISLGLVWFVLLYMGVTAAVVFLRRRRPFLPRQPNTIASVLAFIHQSKMLYDFVGTSKTSPAKMVQMLEGIGKTYGLGWFQGRDGHTHCGVDQEELMSSYRLGYDYSRSNQPWLDTVTWL